MRKTGIKSKNTSLKEFLDRDLNGVPALIVNDGFGSICLKCKYLDYETFDCTTGSEYYCVISDFSLFEEIENK